MYQNIFNQGIEPKLFINNFLEILYYLKNHKNINKLNSSVDFIDDDFEKIKNLSNKVETVLSNEPDDCASNNDCADTNTEFKSFSGEGRRLGSS